MTPKDRLVGLLRELRAEARTLEHLAERELRDERMPSSRGQIGGVYKRAAQRLSKLIEKYG